MTQTNQFKDISQPLIAIMGATASGKTALACHLYERNPSKHAIISVDSALVYTDMNIGTAKPTAQELVQYPHDLVDIITPEQTYSAANFAKDATKLIKDYQQQGITPILVGGTMLYYKALFGGFDELPEVNLEVRHKLEQQKNEQGLASLYAMLQTHDPVTAQRLHTTDTQRIMRALEVALSTGKPLSSYHTKSDTNVALPKAWNIYSIEPERAVLHERIHMRLEQMWQQGFVEEVEGLLSKYQLDADMPSIRAVGYRQVYEFLKETKQTNNDRQMMKDKALFATRQLAKRQCTWLRKFKITYDTNVYASSELAIRTIA